MKLLKLLFLLGGKNLHCYDPLHRNPLYCGADRTCLWELKKVKCSYERVSLYMQGPACQEKQISLSDLLLLELAL